MRQENIRLNGSYRLKADVYANSVQANGKPLPSIDVTIVRAKFKPGRKLAWYYDGNGNAYRASDFEKAVEVIAVEV